MYMHRNKGLQTFKLTQISNFIFIKDLDLELFTKVDLLLPLKYFFL